MTKHLPFLSIISLILTAFLVGLIFVWSFWPYDIITFKDVKAVQVDKQSYRPGERIVYTLDYCKNLAFPAKITRALVNSIRINYTSVYANLPTGCHVTRMNDLVIPDFIDSGNYHIETVLEYEVNPVRTEQINWRSVDFQIVK